MNPFHGREWDSYDTAFSGAYETEKGMYTLTLTEKDIETIYFVGNRYNWSDALIRAGIVSDEVNVFSESEAWAIRDGFDADMEGNHSLFPMLDSHSELYIKLVEFMESIV